MFIHIYKEGNIYFSVLETKFYSLENYQWENIKSHLIHWFWYQLIPSTSS